MVDASVMVRGRRPAMGPVQRRRAALLAGSILFHIAILTPLALRFFEKPLVVQTRDLERAIYLEIEPRPLLKGETARPTATASAAEPTPTVGQIQTGRSVTTAAVSQADAQPSPLTPHIAPNAPTEATQAADDAWRVTPESMSAAVARSLRTGAAGCRAMDGRLSPGEQQLCDDRFNEAAGRAGPLGPRTLNASEARREAQFAQDGAAAFAAHEALRARRAGVGVSGASPECIGGNLRGTCAGAYLRPEFQHSEDAPFGGSAGPK